MGAGAEPGYCLAILGLAFVTHNKRRGPAGPTGGWRFGDPAEFGHNYLPWAKKLSTGIFDAAYLPRNLYHAVARWPEWTGGSPPLSFDPWGTAFYINQGILLFVLWGLAARRFDPVVKATAGFAMAAIAAGIFTYEAGAGGSSAIATSST